MVTKLEEVLLVVFWAIHVYYTTEKHKDSVMVKVFSKY